MIRVLSVIHYPFFGGPQNQLLRLDGPLRRRGFSTLAVLPNEPGNAYDRLTAGGIDVIRIPLGRLRAAADWRVQGRALGLLARDVPRIARLIRAQRIDLVVVHGLVNPQGAVAARLCGRPVVWQVLDTRTPQAVRLMLAPLVRMLASTVMTTGRAVADEHPGLPRTAERLHPFFPPVDTRVFAPDEASRAAVRQSLGVSEHDVLVGCVANLTPQKDLETFLAVARSVRRVRPDVRFALFGSTMETQTAYATRLLAGAAELRHEGTLIVRDVGAEVAEHLRSLDVFLATAPPRSEGISTTILEAMASGVPVVSTDVGAIREAVIHGATGIIVPPSDRGALQRSVINLVDDARYRRSLADAARERAIREFDVERCADVHVRAFEAALRRAK